MNRMTHLGTIFEIGLPKPLTHFTLRVEYCLMFTVLALPRTRRPKPLLSQKVGIFLFG
jgi:hypothetical protein